MHDTRPNRFYASRIANSAAAATIAAATAVGLAAPVRSQPASANVPPAGTIVKLDLTGERPIVTAAVAGKGPFRFLFDSAGEQFLLDDDVAAVAHLAPIRKTAATGSIASLGAEVNVVKVPKLRVGEAIFDDVEAVVTDLDAFYGGKRHADGRLPLSVFGAALVTLDLPHEQLVIRPGPLDPASSTPLVSCGTGDRSLCVNLRVDPVKLPLVIDSLWSGALSAPPAVRKLMPLAFRPSDRSSRRPVFSDMTLDTPVIGGPVKLGSLELYRIPVTFRDGQPNLGRLILKHFAVTFDQSSRRVRFDRENGKPVMVASEPRFGIELVRAGNGLRVLGIYPDSPIDKSAIHIDDHITQLERERVINMSDDDIRILLRQADQLIFKVDRMGFPLLVGVRASDFWKPRSRD